MSDALPMNDTPPVAEKQARKLLAKSNGSLFKSLISTPPLPDELMLRIWPRFPGGLPGHERLYIQKSMLEPFFLSCPFPSNSGPS